MLRSVFGKTLYEARRGLIAWAVGVVALVAMLVAMYPTVRTGDYRRMVAESPEALLRAFGMAPGSDVTSGAGYLGGYLFGFMLPLLLMIFAITVGAGAVAGEEDRGTLDLLGSLPLTRTRIVVEKFAAFMLMAVILGALVVGAVLAGAPLVDLNVDPGSLIATTASHVLLAVLFGGIAMAVGAATGSRPLAVGVSVICAVAAYLAHSLAPLSHALEPARRFSPIYWATDGQPLQQGLDWGLLLLAAVTAVVVTAGAAVFDRRDLGR